MTPPVRLARTAGLYYLAVAVLGGFAHVVRTQVYVAGDPATTLQHVTEHATLVRLSFVADLASATFMVFLVLALFRLLRDVDRPTARLMVTLVTVFVAHHQPEHGEPVRGAHGRHRAGVRRALRSRRLRRDGAAADGAPAHGLPGRADLLRPLAASPRPARAPVRPVPARDRLALIAAAVAYVVDVAFQLLAPAGAATVSGAVIVPIVTLAECSMLGYLLVKGVRSSPALPPASSDRPLVHA